MRPLFARIFAASSLPARRVPHSGELFQRLSFSGLLVALLLAVAVDTAHAAPATKLAITSVNGGANPTAGTAFSLVIQSQSNNGNAANVSNATGVSLSLKTGTGTLGGTLTGTIAAGTSQVTVTGVTYTKAESGVSLTATRTSGDNLTAGSSATFTVNPGAAAGLAFTTQPGNAIAGNAIPGPPKVTVRDANGNTVTGSTAAITVAIGTNAGGGTLSGTTTVSAVSGVATFSTLSIDKVGAGYTLAATSGSLTGATSSGLTITAGTATKLVFGQQPTNTVAGQSVSPALTVQIQDQFGNLTGSTASVTVAIVTNPGGGTLSGTTTVNAVSGTATFSTLSLDKSGAGYTLSATSGSLTGATSSAFTITAAAANKLAFGQQPTNTTAGQSISPAITVQIQDQFGNLTASTASVTLAIGTNPGGGTLSGTATVNAVSGVATLSSLSLNKVGSGYTLAATSSGLSGATSGGFSITAAAANKLAFAQQPTTTTAAQSIAPAVTVQIQDQFGNLTASTASVTIAIAANPGNGTLSGTATANAVSGIANFSNLSIDKAAAGYTLSATATGLTVATSSGFTIAAATANRLTFSQPPTNTGAGQTIAPAVTVQIQDQSGNLTTSTASVTISIGTNPGGGTLSGTATVNAVSGVATFSDLSIDQIGVGYTLSATSAGLTGATSGAFTVTLGGPSISYIYDALGRLRAVVDPATNEVAIYNYDAVGNLVSIVRQSAALVSIIEITPESGAAGGAVTIAGTGFSAVAGQNTVTVNGSAATVVSASPTRITATVPTGATSGTVVVNAPGGMASSQTPFTVNTGVPPTITGFSPTMGTTGTAVTITGTNFSDVASTQIFFNTNARRSTATTASPTQLSTTVPSVVGSGRLMVATPTGQAVSTADFFVPPAPYTVADVQVTGRIAPGDPDLVVNITTGAKIGLFAFDAIAGQHITLGVNGAASTISILGLDGSTLFTVHPPGHVNMQAPRTGTYTLLVRLDGTTTGSVTLTLTQPVGGTITTADAPLAVTLRPGQGIWKTFSGTAGASVTLAVSSISGLSTTCFLNGDPAITVAILNPDGTTLASTVSALCGNHVNAQLPTTGTYTAYVDVVQARSGTLTLTLSNPVGGVITTIDPPLAITLRPGQGIRKPFAGTAGDWVSLAVSNSNSLVTTCYVPGDPAITLAILNPDGTTLASIVLACGDHLRVQLPTTGTYTAYVEVWQARSGTLTLTLSNPVGGVITTIDNPLQVDLRPGQGIRKTFSGTAGMWVSLALSSIEAPNQQLNRPGLSDGCAPSQYNITFWIEKPDGTMLPSAATNQCGNHLNAQLPTTGTYAAWVEVGGARFGTLTITLSAPIGGTMTIGDPALNLSLRLGQGVRKLFTGTAGAWVRFTVSNISASLSPSCFWIYDNVALAILGTDGSTSLGSATATQCGNYVSVQLPTDGTYTAYIDVRGALSGMLTITLSNGP